LPCGWSCARRQRPVDARPAWFGSDRLAPLLRAHGTDVTFRRNHKSRDYPCARARVRLFSRHALTSFAINHYIRIWGVPIIQPTRVSPMPVRPCRPRRRFGPSEICARFLDERWRVLVRFRSFDRPECDESGHDEGQHDPGTPLRQRQHDRCEPRRNRQKPTRKTEVVQTLQLVYQLRPPRTCQGDTAPHPHSRRSGFPP
jgi:hypothetical protein